MTIEELRRLPFRASEDYYSYLENNKNVLCQESRKQFFSLGGYVTRGSINQQLENTDLNKDFELVYFERKVCTCRLKVLFERFDGGILKNLDKCDSVYWLLKALLDLPCPDSKENGERMTEGDTLQINTKEQIETIERKPSRKGVITYFNVPEIEQVEVDLNRLTPQEIAELEGIDEHKNRNFLERYSI